MISVVTFGTGFSFESVVAKTSGIRTTNSVSGAVSRRFAEYVTSRWRVIIRQASIAIRIRPESFDSLLVAITISIQITSSMRRASVSISRGGTRRGRGAIFSTLTRISEGRIIIRGTTFTSPSHIISESVS